MAQDLERHRRESPYTNELAEVCANSYRAREGYKHLHNHHNLVTQLHKQNVNGLYIDLSGHLPERQRCSHTCLLVFLSAKSREMDRLSTTLQLGPEQYDPVG